MQLNITSTRIKYLGIKTHKDTKDLYSDNYKTDERNGK